MPRLRVHNFTISLDGYGASPNQRLEEPLGEGGRRLHEWIFRTRSGRAMLGQDGGESGINDDLFRRPFDRDRCHHHGPQHVRPDSERLAR